MWTASADARDARPAPLTASRGFAVPARSGRRATVPEAAAMAALFVYATWFRVHGIQNDFPLLGDQVRDWAIALGPASSLPLVGTPSTAGGHTLGPLYYWLIWLSRVTIGPFFDNLPHAGGIGLSVVQGSADLVLLHALWRRLGSGLLALATSLLVATSPFEAAVTASVWNPQVAVAFSKVAIALVLLGRGREGRLWPIVTAAAAWLAVQAHSSAFFVAAAVLPWLVVRSWLSGGLRNAAWALYDLVAIVLILQVPFFLHHVMHAEAGAGPGNAIGAAARAATGQEPLHVMASLKALAHSIEITLLEPARPGWTWVVLVVASVVVVAATMYPQGTHGAARRPASSPWPQPGLDVVFVTIVPLVLAAIAYSALARHGDYWYLCLAPSAAVLVASAAATLLPEPRWRALAGAIGLAALAWAQPARFHYSRLINRLPEYGTLVSASRQMVRDGVAPRDIHARFVKQDTDPTFLFTVLGGRLDPKSHIEAEILPTGRIVYRGVGP